MAVSDPFRSLENAADPETAQWVEAQNALTRQCLEGPLREELVGRLQQLHRYPRSSIPAVRSGRLFFTHNDGTANQAALCVLDGPGQSRCRVLVDPNALDPDGTTAITAFAPDDEGGRVAYALSRHGSDGQELRVVDVETGRDLPDSVRWVKFAAIAWLRNGFFYTRFPTPDSVPPEHAQYLCQVWFHSLGSPQGADRLVYHRPDAPAVVFDVDVTSDGTHLVLTSRPGASDK
ncbi:MAG: S9 family peptidase, partial [Chloroflexota bacterium]